MVKICKYSLNFSGGGGYNTYNRFFLQNKQNKEVIHKIIKRVRNYKKEEGRRYDAREKSKKAI